MKLQPKKCGTCRFCDRDSYRAVKRVVCYQINQKDGKKIATQIAETKLACNCYIGS